MPNTALPLVEIKRRYAIRRRRQWFVAGPVIVALVSLWIWLRVTGTEEADWLRPTVRVASLAVLGLFVFSLFNWRCPRCNAYLGRWSFKHCSNCGIELR
jgi:hypothetical protein